MPRAKSPRQNDQVEAKPIFSLIQSSVRLARDNYEQIAILYFIPSLLPLLAYYYLGTTSYSTLSKLSFHGHQWVGVFLLILWLLISIINLGPTIYFRLHASKDKNAPSVGECYKEGLILLPRVWATTILAYVSIAIGLVLLVVPGILFFRKYILTPYYAADNPNLPIREVFKLSSFQSKSFSYTIYTTYVSLIIIYLVLELIAGGNVFTEILSIVIGYLFIFIPALRYNEIRSFFKKKPS